MWNRIVLVLGTLSLLLAASVLPIAQEEAPTDEDSSYLVVYSLEGLPIREARGPDTTMPRPVPQLRANALLGGWFWEDNPRELDQWSPAVLQMASMDQREGSELHTAIEVFDLPDSRVNAWYVDGIKQRLEVEADADGHRLVSAFLDQLRSWYRQRVHLDIYRLPEVRRGIHVAAGELPKLREGAERIGKVEGAPGEFLSVRKSESVVLLTDMELWSTSDEVIPHPVIRRFPTGWEVSAGVVPLPGGSLWIQGTHVESELLEKRNVDAFVGEVEAPRIRVDYSPASAIILPGDGFVVGGRYLVVPRVDGYEEPVQEGAWWIGVPTTHLRPGALQGGAWPGEERVELGFGAWPEEDELEQRIVEGVDVFSGAASTVEERHTHDLNARSFGPVVAICGEPDGDESEQREFRLALAALKKTPESLVFRVRIASVDADGDSGDDVPELLESGDMLADLDLSCRVGQAADWDRLFAENYLHYGNATSVHRHQDRDPVLQAAVWGTKVRLSCHRSGDKIRVEVPAAHAPGAQIRNQEIPVGDSTTHLEYADIPTAHLQLTGDLAVGERADTLTQHPTDEGKRLVMVVERVK